MVTEGCVHPTPYPLSTPMIAAPVAKVRCSEKRIGKMIVKKWNGAKGNSATDKNDGRLT